LVIFALQKVIQIGAEVEDLVITVQACLSEKMFDRPATIAKEAIELDPAKEKAKDILRKSSIEKNMNSDVPMMICEGKK
jgi:hypothetical protein